MEANKYAWQVTPHHCDAPNENGHYENCSRPGTCHQNTKNGLSDLYGPDSHIDTTQPIHYKLDFNANSGTFTNFFITLSQGDNELTMDGDCSSNSQL